MSLIIAKSASPSGIKNEPLKFRFLIVLLATVDISKGTQPSESAKVEISTGKISNIDTGGTNLDRGNMGFTWSV